MIVLYVVVIIAVVAFSDWYYTTGPHSVNDQKRNRYRRRLACQTRTRELEKALFPDNPLFELACYWWDPKTGAELDYLAELDQLDIPLVYPVPKDRPVNDRLIGPEGDTLRAKMQSAREQILMAYSVPASCTWTWPDGSIRLSPPPTDYGHDPSCCDRYSSAHWSDSNPPDWHGTGFRNPDSVGYQGVPKGLVRGRDLDKLTSWLRPGPG
jgi:hypothetical protein